MKRIILKPGEEKRILRGHPWVYGNEVEKILKGAGDAGVPAELEPGEMADGPYPIVYTRRSSKPRW